LDRIVRDATVCVEKSYINLARTVVVDVCCRWTAVLAAAAATAAAWPDWRMDAGRTAQIGSAA